MPKGLFAIFAAAVSLAAGIGRADTVVVSPGNLQGWSFGTTDSSGVLGTGAAGTSAGLVNGPATPPLGDGSANLKTGPDAGDGSAQMRASLELGTLISNLTVLSYSTYASAWNGQQVPYLTLYLDNGDRLFFEPDYSSAGAGNGNPNPQDPAALNTWQSWDAIGGMWYSQIYGGPGSNALTWNAIVALETVGGTVDVRLANNSQGGTVRLASGFGSTSNNFNANVDAFTIGTADGSRTFNFEATDAAATPLPAPLGLGIVMLGIFGSVAAVRNHRMRLMSATR